MHVGLNLVYLVPGETGGMEVYGRELAGALTQVDPGLRLTAFVNREARESGGLFGGAIEEVTVPVNARNRLQWVRGEQQHLPRLAGRAGCDLVHSMASTAPLWGSFRRVVTIHDLAFRVVPEAHLGALSVGMRVLVPAAAHRAHAIIADSESTRTDLLSHYRLARKRIDVVALGVRAPAEEPAGLGDRARARFDLGDRPVVFSLSAKRPHKNLARLIEALAAIPAARRPMLVIAGYPTPHEAELVTLAGRLGVKPDVRMLGWVSGADVEDLYAVASVFAFPSLYEGFGLPVLEAMARGVPVVTSDRGSLPEVAGDAALTADPLSPAAIAASIERLLGDEELAGRLRVLGRTQAARFTWESTARETLRVYERALS